MKNRVFYQKNPVFRLKYQVFHRLKNHVYQSKLKNPFFRLKNWGLLINRLFLIEKPGFSIDKPGFSIKKKKTGFLTKTFFFFFFDPIFQIWLINLVFQLAKIPVFRSKNLFFSAKNRVFRSRYGTKFFDLLELSLR